MTNGADTTMTADSQVIGIGQFIQRRREELKLSVEEVVAQAGISATYLRKIESGHVKSPSFNVIFRLARILKIGLDELDKIFANEEEMMIEREIQAIHTRFPDLKIAAASNISLPTLGTKRQYLTLLKTLVKYQEQPNDEES